MSKQAELTVFCCIMGAVIIGMAACWAVAGPMGKLIPEVQNFVVQVIAIERNR
jgi:hypothetical protein